MKAAVKTAAKLKTSDGGGGSLRCPPLMLQLFKSPLRSERILGEIRVCTFTRSSLIVLYDQITWLLFSKHEDHC